MLTWPCSTHPGCVSGTVLRATTTTSHQQKVSSVLSYSFLFESRRETMLLTTCRNLIHAEIWFMQKTVLWPSFTFPRNLHFICPHGICYGFEVMQSSELPRHPFQIFRQRFHTAPRVIMCANRTNTVWTGSQTSSCSKPFSLAHVGCSLGYCLDTYKHMSLKEINSQVNEQANAGLQRQLAYMTPHNFMFTISLFILVKNMDIQRKLDVSSIRIWYLFLFVSALYHIIIHTVIFNLSIRILLKHV